MEKLKMTIGDNVATYDKSKGCVNYEVDKRDNQISISCKIPVNWGIIRVAQFMQSLLEAKIV